MFSWLTSQREKDFLGKFEALRSDYYKLLKLYERLDSKVDGIISRNFEEMVPRIFEADKNSQYKMHEKFIKKERKKPGPKPKVKVGSKNDKP